MTHLTQATAHENGQSTFAVDLTVGGHTLVGDEPVASGGLNLGPAPFDLLSAALAECTAMTVRFSARRHAIALDGVKVEVTYTPPAAADGPTARATFHKVVHLEGAQLTDAHRQKLLQAAGRCPVQRVLEQGCIVLSEASRS